MKALRRMSWGAVTLSLLIGLAGSFGGPAEVAQAATSPSLGAAATYGVLASTYTNPTGPTTVNGDVGFSIGPAVTPLPLPRPSGTYPNFGLGGNYSSAGTAQGTALASLNGQPCTSIAGPLNAVVIGANAPGVFPPGCYEITGAMTIALSTTVTLDKSAPGGSGSTFIFRAAGGALTTGADAIVALANGASSCDVFWAPTGATSLGANTLFKGTVIDDAGITVGDTVNWEGRALAFGGTVTTPATNATITVPACAAPSSSSGSSSFTGTITVVKNVINDNGRTKVAADFPLFIDGNAVVSGVSNAFSFFSGTAHTVTETGSAQYARSFSGDCDASGGLFLDPAENLFCIVTNDDIGAPVVVPPVPPLIDVVKVPSPLALPAGPGPVQYTYTARNIGTVPMTDVTLVGDTCAPIVLVSGDVDGDNRLDVDETWVHTCSTTLSETHTNTVVATGWANGLSAVDVASATVVVGTPVVPPLIHVTKVPSPLTLLAGGGTVSYTKKVTNPGTVPLENVRVTDDKCSPVALVSGDADGDAKLDPSETWTYACSSNLTKTTTNTAVAIGEANGFTVRDFAIATVVVAGAVPSLPNTGTSPTQAVPALAAVVALFAASGLLFARRRKQAR